VLLNASDQSIEEGILVLACAGPGLIWLHGRERPAHIGGRAVRVDEPERIETVVGGVVETGRWRMALDDCERPRGFGVAREERRASCNLSLSFVPQTTGGIASSATFTDNALNASSATQSVTLGGTGLVANQAISFTTQAPVSASYYSAFPVAAQSTSGLTVALAVDASSAGICSIGTSTVAGAVTTATVTMMSATGFCTIDANQSGNSNYNPATQLQTVAAAATIGTSLTVTNTNDSGFGSLRDAVANAVSGDTINFSLP
jgi:hypothetical protein